MDGTSATLRRSRAMIATAAPDAAALPVPREAGFRNRWVELLRLIAAFGIVWYHAGYRPGHDFAYAGLAVFIALAAYFAAQQRRVVSVAGAARRLLLPWAVWLVFYAALNLVQGQPAFPFAGIAGFFYGSSPHLWFLPFIFVATIVIAFTRSRIAYPSVFALGVLLVTVSLWRLTANRAGPPITQYVQALAPLLFGIVLAQRHPGWRVATYVAMIGMAYAIDERGVGTPYLIGAVAVLCAVDLATVDTSRLRVIDRLSPLTFGVYLMHPFFLGLMRLAHLGGLVRIGGAFVLAMAATWLVRCHPAGRAIT